MRYPIKHSIEICLLEQLYEEGSRWRDTHVEPNDGFDQLLHGELFPNPIHWGHTTLLNEDSPRTFEYSEATRLRILFGEPGGEGEDTPTPKVSATNNSSIGQRSRLSIKNLNSYRVTIVDSQTGEVTRALNPGEAFEATLRHGEGFFVAYDIGQEEKTGAAILYALDASNGIMAKVEIPLGVATVRDMYYAYLLKGVTLKRQGAYDGQPLAYKGVTSMVYSPLRSMKSVEKDYKENGGKHWFMHYYFATLVYNNEKALRRLQFHKILSASDRQKIKTVFAGEKESGIDQPFDEFESNIKATIDEAITYLDAFDCYESPRNLRKIYYRYLSSIKDKSALLADFGVSGDGFFVANMRTVPREQYNGFQWDDFALDTVADIIESAVS